MSHLRGQKERVAQGLATVPPLSRLPCFLGWSPEDPTEQTGVAGSAVETSGSGNSRLGLFPRLWATVPVIELHSFTVPLVLRLHVIQCQSKT